jgi:hypothetical protein
LELAWLAMADAQVLVPVLGLANVANPHVAPENAIEPALPLAGVTVTVTGLVPLVVGLKFKGPTVHEAPTVKI